MDEEIVVLVDYDNTKIEGNERTSSDLRANLEDIRNAFLEVLKRIDGNIRIIHIYWYGGWIGENGKYSLLGRFIYQENRHLSAKIKGITVVSHIASTISILGAENLLGTCRHSEHRFFQKMVDTIMCVDLIHFCKDHRVVVVSDDDDFVPAVVYCACNDWPVTLLRSCEAGAALNDDLLVSKGVSLISWEQR